MSCAVDASHGRIGEAIHIRARLRERERLVAVAFVVALALLLLMLLLHPWRSGSAGRSGSVSAIRQQHHAASNPSSRSHLPAMVCVGPQHAMATSPPTKQDYRWLKEHPLKQLPTEITGRRLPNGTIVGTCLYNGASPTPAQLGSNY